MAGTCSTARAASDSPRQTPPRFSAMSEQEAAEAEGDISIDEPHKVQIPTHRVKKIMKLDKDINRCTSEALFLVASSTELFLQFLAEESARVAMEKKKRTVKIEHLRVAVKWPRPTADFLLDCLPVDPQPSDQNPPKVRAKSGPDKKPLPFATKANEAFFQKCT